jgi:hypothetical protein
MSRKSILMSAFMVAVVAVSCGQKVQEPLTEAPFVTTLTEAKTAAAGSKAILLDFYTHW